MKYKVIYEHLQQKGGSEYNLPCDITYYTDSIHYSLPKSFPIPNELDIGKDINKYLGESSININFDYHQDPYVQLYNGNKYYNIVKNKEKLTFIINKNYCNNKDGCICNIRGNISNFCYLEEFSVPSFNINKYCDSVITNPEIKNNHIFGNDEFIFYDDKKLDIVFEQSKGGNYISAPNNTIFYIDGTNIIIDEIKKINCDIKYVELKCSFKASNIFRHIDELMCFMPYGITKYKIWFYDKFNKIHFNNSEKYTLDKISEINKERLDNLEKISQALFSDTFDNCIDNFVFFDFYIWTQSIFNRTWYEKKDKCICLFPELKPDVSTLLKVSLIECLNDKIKNEMNNIYSYINNNKPTYHFIKVNDVNIQEPHGTLHCLIKQRFISI